MVPWCELEDTLTAISQKVVIMNFQIYDVQGGWALELSRAHSPKHV